MKIKKLTLLAAMGAVVVLLAGSLQAAKLDGIFWAKNKTPFRAVLRPRRRLNWWCAVDCACGGPGSVLTPVPFYCYLLLFRGHPAPYVQERQRTPISYCSSNGGLLVGTAMRRHRPPEILSVQSMAGPTWAGQ